MLLFTTLYTWLKAKADSGERGAVLAEYGLLLALIAAAVVTAIVALRTGIIATFNRATGELPQ
jgi:Flp pilus assembly pilin Flp